MVIFIVLIVFIPLEQKIGEQQELKIQHAQ